MKKVFVLLFACTMLLIGCSGEKRDRAEDVKKEYMAKVNKVLSDGELMNYINGEIKLVEAKGEFNTSLTFYDFVLEAELTDDFADLSVNERYDIIEDIGDVTLDGAFIGENSNCRIETFTLKDGTDTYVVETSFGYSVSLNGEYFKREVENVSTPLPSSSNDSGDSNKEAIYLYMKEQYDIITNYGENYTPEIHDPQVAELAAQRFGITVSEADQIYIEMEMSGY